MLPSPDVILNAVGYGLLVPALVTVVALLLAVRLGGGEPAAVGAGLAAGFAALPATGQIGLEIYRPVEAWDWLPLLGLLAAAAGWIEQIGKGSRAVRWVGRLLVVGLTAGLLVRAQAAREPKPIALSWYPVVALVVLALWGVLDLSARRRPSAVTPALLAGVGLAAAAVAEFAAFTRVAQMGGVVAGTMGGWAIVAWRRPREGVVQAGVACLSVLLPGLLFAAYFNGYGDVPAASYLLLLAAPLLLGAVTLLPSPDPAPLWRGLLRVAAVLLPLGAGLALAALS